MNSKKEYALINSRWVRVHRVGYDSYVTKKEPNVRFSGSLYPMKKTGW